MECGSTTDLHQKVQGEPEHVLEKGLKLVKFGSSPPLNKLKLHAVALLA